MRPRARGRRGASNVIQGVFREHLVADQREAVLLAQGRERVELAAARGGIRSDCSG